ncbi:GTPase-associated system all-helical protein GASH [Pseudomonas syringae pv. syringae]|uniref:GTPase-associated system all-helical protein GASH n=1 Tax=Pseudomonas syringae TaxID=317 RepID=UPI003AFFE13F
MMMAKTPEMTAEFAQWYLDAFMDDGEVRSHRWKGVVATAQIANHLMVEVLVRYAFATKAPAAGGKNEELSKTHQTLLAKISGTESPMDPSEFRRELEILSAAVLVELFATLPDAAIAVLNASCGGKRIVDLPMDLVGRAKKAMVAFSYKKQQRPTDKELKIVSPAFEFEVSEEAAASMTPALWKTELENLHEAAQGAVDHVIDQQNEITRLLVRQVSLGEEELQMLWWLIGGHSSTLDAPFTEIPTSVKPLVFGKELGRLAQISPGPASIAAIMARAGLASDTVSVLDVVNVANMQWIEEATDSSRLSPVTTPLHFALETRHDIESDDAWLPVWASKSGLPADTCMSTVQIAELFYREHLFLFVGH